MSVKSLTPEAIAADFEHVSYLFDANARIQRHPSDVARAAEASEEIQQLMRKRPAFFRRFDYGWAASLRYQSGIEAWLQLEALSVLSLIPDDHPDLVRHRPTVVRLVATADYATTTVSGRVCDFVLLSEPYLSLVREFAVLLRSLHGLADLSSPANYLDASWLMKATRSLVDKGEQAVSDMYRPLQEHAVALARNEQPRVSPPQLGAWLQDAVSAGDPLAQDLACRYVAVDRFVLFHELGHLLRTDPYTQPRSAIAEFHADRTAVSLALARLESSPSEANHDVVQGVMRDVALGGATFLQLMRLVTLFGETHRWVAVMADQAYGTNQEPLREARNNLDELEGRLLNLVYVASEFMSSKFAEIVLAQIQALDAVVSVAKMMLLDDGGFDVFNASPERRLPLQMNYGDVMSRVSATLRNASAQ